MQIVAFMHIDYNSQDSPNIGRPSLHIHVVNSLFLSGLRGEFVGGVNLEGEFNFATLYPGV